MKKIISLLFIIMLVLFTNINTLSDYENSIDNVELTQVLHLNNDMILTKQDNAIIIYEEKVISIIEESNENIFTYIRNKSITKCNDSACAISPEKEKQRELGIKTNPVSNLLRRGLARSDTKNKMGDASIRGPCSKWDFLKNDINPITLQT
jgi:thioredoxin-related protein